MKLIKIIIAFIIIALLVIGAMRLVKKRKAQEASIPPAKSYALVVKTLELHKKPCRLSLPALAVAKSLSQERIASKVAGRVLYVALSGRKLKKGALLIRIDDTPLKAKLQSLLQSLASTKAALEAARENLRVLQSIHKRSAVLMTVGGVAKERFEKEKAQIASAKSKVASIQAKIASLKANMAEVKDQLSYTKIYAKNDGVVVSNMVNVGDFAAPGQPLLVFATKGKSILTLLLPTTLKAKKVLYKGKLYQLQPLHSTKNGAMLYSFVPQGFVEDGAKERVSLITYDDVGYCVPKSALIDGKIVLLDKKAVPVKVNILARGIEGVAIEGDLEGKKMIVAKPDILLEALAGRAVKGQ